MTEAAVPVLTDGVISVRPWAPEDASFLVEASSDPAIRRYSLSRSRSFSTDEAQAQLQDCEPYRLTANAEGRPSGSLVITDATTGLALGQCGIDGWSPGDVAQIGYWLTPKSRGRGVATRAVVQLTNWLFHLGARRVRLTVVDDNAASVAVARGGGVDGRTECLGGSPSRRRGLLGHGGRMEAATVKRREGPADREPHEAERSRRSRSRHTPD